MINFLKTKIALLWAKKHTQNAEIYKQNAVADQEKLLFSLLKTAENTLFGKEHHFGEIQSIRDFQEKVPISDYEDLKPYIERIKNGKKDIL